MIALYMDENVHGAITTQLRRRGVDVVTAQDDGREGYADPEVLDRADQLQRVLFSCDSDLLIEATLRQRSARGFPGVIYAHPSVPVGRCVADLELLALIGTPSDFSGQVVYLPL